MNISLVYPILKPERNKKEQGKQYWPPLGLAYLAAVLENSGHSVRIIDRDILLRKNSMDMAKTDKDTFDGIAEFGSEIVGYSATTPHVSDVSIFSAMVKRSRPRILQVIGGPHCVGAPKETLDYCPSIDLLARGEGEGTISDIAAGMDISNIDGLCYRAHGNIMSNKDRPLIADLDTIPIPARHLLDMDFYLRPNRFAGRNFALRTTSIITSRGCPYLCDYCAGPLNFPGRVRFHSAGRVVSEISALAEKYGIECLYFADDMFLSNAGLAKKIMEEFVKLGLNKRISWIAQLHPKAASPEFLALMKKASCIQAEFGFESGSQRILDLMNKKSSVELNLRAAAMTRSAGIRLRGNFIVGYPGETEADFKKTVDFIKKARPHHIGLHLLMPLPGTKVYSELKKAGKTINWQDMGDDTDLAGNYSGMDAAAFRRLYFRTYLTVLLPINIFYFVRDNIKNPFRMLWIALKQAGQLVAAVKSFVGSRRKGNRVVMVAPFGTEPFGTVNARILPMAQALKGYDVSVVIPPIFNVEQSEKALVQEGVTLYNVKVFKDFSAWQVPALTVRMIMKVNSLRPDIIHVFKPKGMSGFVAMYYILRGRRVIIDTDDLEGKGGWNDVLDYPSWVKGLIDLQERWLYRHAWAVTAASRPLEGKIKKLTEESGRVYYVPNSVGGGVFMRDADCEKAKERCGLSRRPVILLYTRFFEFDVKKIIDITRSLDTAARPVVLVVGKGPNGEEEKLMRMAASEGLSDLFVYKGFLTGDELREHISCADLAVHPFADMPINKYKSPFKILEVMSYGKPVVVDAVGQNKEYVVHGHSGFLASPSDTGEFSGYVKKLLADSALRMAMGRNARNRVIEYFSWRQNIKVIEGLYSKCAG